MIRYVLPAAVAVLALNAPLAARAQVVQPIPQPQPAPDYTTKTSTTTTISREPRAVRPGYTEEETETYSTIGPGLAPPPYAQPTPMVMVSPRTTWIPGHFEWDPASSNYLWIEGQFVEAPRENAQWIPGHWTETPTAWIWINGGWN